MEVFVCQQLKDLRERSHPAFQRGNAAIEIFRHDNGISNGNKVNPIGSPGCEGARRWNLDLDWRLGR